MDIKRRIASTKKTGQITGAMQMVSGAKLSQIEKKSRAYQLYFEKIRQIVTHLAAAQLLALSKEKKERRKQATTHDEKSNYVEHDFKVSDLLIERPIEKTGYLVITSDRGLVGGYNSSILKEMMQMIETNHDSQDEYAILAIGGTGADFFKARGIKPAYEFRGISDVPNFNEVRQIVKTAVMMYDQQIFDELYVCYNHHINSLSSGFTAEKMLPVTDLDASEVENQDLEYITEPSVDEALDVILPQYAESLVFGAILDAKTAEHAASMTAMKSATDNAEQIISDLSIKYNRARQAQITTEITEIVGGAAALE